MCSIWKVTLLFSISKHHSQIELLKKRLFLKKSYNTKFVYIYSYIFTFKYMYLYIYLSTYIFAIAKNIYERRKPNMLQGQ